MGIVPDHRMPKTGHQLDPGDVVYQTFTKEWGPTSLAVSSDGTRMSFDYCQRNVTEKEPGARTRHLKITQLSTGKKDVSVELVGDWDDAHFRTLDDDWRGDQGLPYQEDLGEGEDDWGNGYEEDFEWRHFELNVTSYSERPLPPPEKKSEPVKKAKKRL